MVSTPTLCYFSSEYCSMDKTYRAHPFLTELDSLVVKYITFGIAVCWCMLLGLCFTYDLVLGPLLRLGLSLSLAILLIGIFSRTMIREYATATVTVAEQGIIYKTRSSVRALAFEEITAFTAAWGIGGYCVELRGGAKRFRLPFLFEESSRLLSDIRDSLVLSGNLEAINQSITASMIKRAIRSDGSVRRWYRHLRLLSRLSLFSFLGGFVTALCIWSLSLVSSLIWGIFSAVIPLFSFALADHFIRLRRDPEDIQTTEKILIRTGCVSACGYCCIGIIAKFFL